MISGLCPDIVTLNQEMPDLNGLDVLTQIIRTYMTIFCHIGNFKFNIF